MISDFEQFIRSSEEHGRYTLEGDHSKTNAAFQKIKKASLSLRAMPDCGAAAFMNMIEHHDASVRVWAALYLLPTCEAEARTALKAVASGTDIIAFSARVTLKEWDAGRLKIS